MPIPFLALLLLTQDEAPVAVTAVTASGRPVPGVKVYIRDLSAPPTPADGPSRSIWAR